MKATIEVLDQKQNPVWVQSMYDVPTNLQLIREMSRLMEMYPEYSVINLQIEKENNATRIQEPTSSKLGTGPGVGPFRID